MIATGFKIIVQRTDHEVTTWHDGADRKIEDILLEMRDFKLWGNGTVIDAYIELDLNGDYYKIHLDCKRLTKLLVLK